MGGTDEPTNLVEVTVTQHAMFHFCNYQLWGNEEDKLAWRGLSGQVGKEEILYDMIKINQPKAMEAARTPKAIKKKKETFKEIKHQQGEKNSQYGKVWIYSLERRENNRINKGDPIPEGWSLGRIMNFDVYIERLNKKRSKKEKQEKELNKKIEYYSELYDIYLNEGFEYIKTKFNYNKTRENLTMLFKKYVPHYVPFQRLLFQKPT